MSSSSMRIIGSSSTTRIRLACVAGRSVAMLHRSAGTGTHPDRIGLTMHCGCPRALGFARQGTAWAGPALNGLAPGGVPPAPNPQPLTTSGRETLAFCVSQGLLLCTEQAEAGVMATAQDRITIYGPKADGTYLVEFRTAEGDALAISIPRTEAAVIRLPGQDALWAGRS